jgi:hypothetical protein
MLIDIGRNWGFEGQCHGSNIKIFQYSLSRFDGFCGLVFCATFGESISNLDAFQ